MIAPEYLYYAGLIIPLLFIVYSLVKYLGKVTDKRKGVSTARFAFNVAEGHRGAARRKLISGIKEIFGPEAAANVSNGVLWEDMPAYLLFAAQGRPGKVEEAVNEGTLTQKMFFGGSKKTGKKFELEVSLQNHKVRSWKAL